MLEYETHAGTGMLIFVKLLSQKSYCLEVNALDTIESIKDRIYHILGFPCSKQRLIYNGKQLEHGYTLRDYNVQTGSTLNFVLRCRGIMNVAVNVQAQ